MVVQPNMFLSCINSPLTLGMQVLDEREVVCGRTFEATTVSKKDRHITLASRNLICAVSLLHPDIPRCKPLYKPSDFTCSQMAIINAKNIIAGIYSLSYSTILSLSEMNPTPSICDLKSQISNPSSEVLNHLPTTAS
jgi:hypothetical protein